MVDIRFGVTTNDPWSVDEIFVALAVSMSVNVDTSKAFSIYVRLRIVCNQVLCIHTYIRQDVSELL